MLGANRRCRSVEMLSIPTDFLGSIFVKVFLIYPLPTVLNESTTHCLDRRLSKKFERMAREAIDVFWRVLKENNKSGFDSYSVRNSVLIISHIIPFGIIACTF